MRKTLAIALLALSATRIEAQPRTAACSYRQCGLAISPAWSGLDVVRGEERAHVASLGFFLPHRIGASFAANDSASKYAERAFEVRRSAAFATDVGAMLLAYAVARELGSSSRTSRAIGAAGAGLFVIGVPLQFSADDLLSRAVWWYNNRFARE